MLKINHHFILALVEYILFDDFKQTLLTFLSFECRFLWQSILCISSQILVIEVSIEKVVVATITMVCSCRQTYSSLFSLHKS